MFKPGDKIKRLTNNDNIGFIAGEIYTVVRVIVCDKDGIERWGYFNKFEKVIDQTSKQKAEKFLKLLCK